MTRISLLLATALSVTGCNKVVADVQMIGGGSASLVLKSGDDVLFDIDIPGVPASELDFEALDHDNEYDAEPAHAECSGSYAVLESDTYAPGRDEPTYGQFASLEVYLCREPFSTALAEQGFGTTEDGALHFALRREYRLCANHRLEDDGISADANSDSISTVLAATHNDGGGVGSQPCGVPNDEWTEGRVSGQVDWWTSAPGAGAMPVPDTTLDYELTWSFDLATAVQSTVDFTANNIPLY